MATTTAPDSAEKKKNQALARSDRVYWETLDQKEQVHKSVQAKGYKTLSQYIIALLKDGQRSVRLSFSTKEQKEMAYQMARAKGYTLSDYMMMLFWEEQRRQDESD